MIPFRSTMPTLVLNELVIASQVHCKRFSAMRTDGQKLCRNFHIFLPVEHFKNNILILKSFLTARLTALKQTVIALRVEKSLFVKACFLKAMVNICCDYEIILIRHKLQQVLIDRLRRILIAIYENVSAPICPMLLGRFVRVKSARIHILKPVFFLKIGKVFFKPLTVISKACGGITCKVSTILCCSYPKDTIGQLPNRN